MAHDRVAEVVAGLRNTLTNGITDEEQAATAVVLERMARTSAGPAEALAGT